MLCGYVARKEAAATAEETAAIKVAEQAEAAKAERAAAAKIAEDKSAALSIN